MSGCRRRMITTCWAVPGVAAHCSCVRVALSESDVSVLQIDGEIDLGSRKLVRAALATVLDDRPASVLIDLSRLVFCDARGLSMLTDAASVASDRGLYYAVTGVPPHIEWVWARLWHPLPVRHRTVAEGLTAAIDRQAGRSGDADGDARSSHRDDQFRDPVDRVDEQVAPTLSPRRRIHRSTRGTMLTSVGTTMQADVRAALAAMTTPDSR